MIFINCTVNKSTGLFRPFFPVSLPFGIAYLMAVLRRAGLAFDFVDTQVHPNIFREIKHRLAQFPAPRIFCISFLTEAGGRALETARGLKERYPDSIILLGGIHATALPTEMLSHDFIDYVICGEAEGSIIEIYRRLHDGKSIADMPGVGSRSEGQIRINEREAVIGNLDDLPILPYELFSPYKKYDLGYYSISRGCPYQCIYCNNNLTGSRVCRFKSIERALEEMDLLINKYHCKELYFFDDNFLTRPAFIEELCRGIRSLGLEKKAGFSFQSRSRDVKPEIMQEIFRSGFKTIFFGIESVSDHLLEKIGKKESIAEITRAVSLAKETGFKVIANYMFCLPEERPQDRSDCVEFSKKHEIDVVKFNNVVPYPGTAMFADYLNPSAREKSANYTNYNSQLVLVTPFWKKVRFPYLPANTKGRDIRIDTMRSYLRFYLRSDMLKNMLKRNWGGLVFRFGDSFVGSLKNLPFLFILSFDIFVKLLWYALSKKHRHQKKIKDVLL